ncbi:hypothetical protein ACEWY4_012633 [Coilia grayii]|uniref:Coiled-coil domain-containing protein 112 n=1 Tax=Coilia grayii TaxID=363190 RepID=A0ABD1K164_9TELE
MTCHRDSMKQLDNTTELKIFLQEVEHLKKLVEKNEKETWLKIHWKNGLGDYFSGVKELDEKLKNNLNNDRIRVEQQLVKLRHGVRGFQEQLTDVKPSNELVEKLQEIMTEVETSFNTFKLDQHQSFEDLLKEERVCWQELSAFEKKMELWSYTDKSDSMPHTAQSGRVHATIVSHSDCGPPEVKALDTFLQQTGVYGSWDQYDHQSFLQIWTKHAGRPSYLREAVAYLPARSQEEVLQHEEWYMKLQDLQERRKLAIQRWRREKEREKEERLQQREELLDVQLRQREEKAQKQHQRTEEEKREATARLEEWRSHRQLREEQERERRVKEEVLQKRRLQEQRRRQQEARLVLKASAQQKKEQEERRLAEIAARERAEIEERRKVGEQLIQQFQDRDLHRLEAKLLQKQQREEEDLERRKRLDKLKEKVSPYLSPERLSLSDSLYSKNVVTM